ncbi:hypothetical protein [Massilia sp. LjRoot122]|uniref:hypothetical protein n=1 Tax=Massilia sp. LjRoot122 TaxID=3342257 RepID=UPI003ECFDFB8
MRARLVRKAVGALAQSTRRKRQVLVFKMPIVVLGIGGLLLTTDIAESFKSMWAAGEVAAAAVQNVTQVKQP